MNQRDDISQMSVEEARGLACAYADGELNSVDKARFEAVLAASPDLSCEVEAWRALRCCCGRVLCCEPMPGRLKSRILAELSTHGRSVRPMRSMHWVGLGIAAALMLAILGDTRGSRTVDPRQTAGVAGSVRMVSAERFAEVHLKCGRGGHCQIALDGPCPIAARDKVEHAGIDFQVLLPDFRDEGLELAGICRCFREPGVRALHAYYRRASGDGSCVSVITLNCSARLSCCKKVPCAGKTKRFETTLAQGVSILAWDERGETFALVGQMDESQLLRLAEKATLARAVNLREAPDFAVAELAERGFGRE